MSRLLDSQQLQTRYNMICKKNFSNTTLHMVLWLGKPVAQSGPITRIHYF